MFETLRVVEEIRPKIVIWENVKSVLNKKNINNFKQYETKLRQLGYWSYYKVLNSKDYGVPQNRERIYCVSIRSDYKGCHINNFRFPYPKELKTSVFDILGASVNEKYYLSDKMKRYIKETGTKNFKVKESRINLEIARPLTTEHGKRAGTTNYYCSELPKNIDISNIDITNNNIRRLTPWECFILMGFTYTDYVLCKTAGLSDTQLYKQAGNSIVVNVLMEIIRELIKQKII